MSCDVFMSYTSLKDLGGAVSAFRDHLEIELRKKTGDVSLKVFQDKRSIHGGDKWEQVLVDELASAQLLLVLLSPTWLRSEWCKREYQLFSAAPSLNQAARPIVPLVWDKVSETHARTEEEKRLLADILTNQVLVWDDLQYEDWASPVANRAAGKLAEELALKLSC
jgi:hypothetical protein